MKWIKGIAGMVWKGYFFLVVLLSVIVLYPIYLVVLKRERYFHFGFKLIRIQAKAILFFIGIRRKVIGQIPKEAKTYILCSNHSSYLDILLLYASFPHYFIFLGKKELGKVPLFNLYFKKMNILIDRRNAKASHQSIEKVAMEMRKGHGVVIFPEGTISKTAPQLRPFKNGAFRVAIEQQTPILPITFPDNYKLLQDRWGLKAKCGPGLARIYFHELVEMTGEKMELIPLREQIKKIIESKLP